MVEQDEIAPGSDAMKINPTDPSHPNTIPFYAERNKMDNVDVTLTFDADMEDVDNEEEDNEVFGVVDEDDNNMVQKVKTSNASKLFVNKVGLYFSLL